MVWLQQDLHSQCNGQFDGFGSASLQSFDHVMVRGQSIVTQILRVSPGVVLPRRCSRRSHMTCRFRIPSSTSTRLGSLAPLLADSCARGAGSRVQEMFALVCDIGRARLFQLAYNCYIASRYCMNSQSGSRHRIVMCVLSMRAQYMFCLYVMCRIFPIHLKLRYLVVKRDCYHRWEGIARLPT